MLSPTELYPLVRRWLQSLGVPHAMAAAALADLVTALLISQSLRPSALMRALLSPDGVPARQRYKRVRRVLDRQWLAPAWLGPRLVRAALALVGPEPGAAVHLALDSVRCGPWEIYTLGVVWHGRALPVGWAVLPYPLPKGSFGPTVEALVRAVAAAWPAEHLAPHLLADRAFPSLRFFRALRGLGWGWTIRVRATDGVRVDGEATVVRELLRLAREGGWTARTATFGTGPQAVPGTLVIGRGLEVIPAHQTGPASLALRAGRRARREQHLQTKKPGRDGAGLRAADRWVALFSSQANWQAATRSYGQRWAIEGTYRDAQGGWDGTHGWNLEPTAARLRSAAEVEALVGLWALGALLQSWIGARVGSAEAPPLVQAVAAEWTTTGRLSVWARGRFALTDPRGRLRPWLAEILAAGAARIAAAPHRPAATDPILLPIPSAHHREAA